MHGFWRTTAAGELQLICAKGYTVSSEIGGQIRRSAPGAVIVRVASYGLSAAGQQPHGGRTRMLPPYGRGLRKDARVPFLLQDSREGQ